MRITHKCKILKLSIPLLLLILYCYSPVGFVFGTSVPGMPKNLVVKEHQNCTYEVTYKPADDGGTTSLARVYMSPDKQFKADNITLVKTLHTGESRAVSAVIKKPDCTKPYYFAVVAFSASGARSGVLVQEISVNGAVSVFFDDTVQYDTSVFGQILSGLPGQDVNLTGYTGPVTGSVAGTTAERPHYDDYPDNYIDNSVGSLSVEELQSLSVVSKVSRHGWGIITLLIIALAFITYRLVKKKTRSL